MKKILPLLLLLLVLVLYCVITKKDSIHIPSHTNTLKTTAPALTVDKHTIDYTITQNEKDYVLSGNFKDTQQQQRITDIFSTTGHRLSVKGTSTNQTLHGEEALKLTHEILPHFIANYSNGKIRYHNDILTVSGSVQNYRVKHEMQRLLNSSTLPTQDNTNVILVEPIDFKIKKMGKQLQLSGTFANKKQIHSLTRHMHPSYSTLNLRQNAHRIDKGAIALTQKILPSFTKNYSTGDIHYTHETLIIKGMVDHRQALDEMTQLLSDSKIPVQNLTVINPEILKREQEALLLQKKEEEAAKRAKLEEARKLAEQHAQAKAQLLKESEKKAREEKEKLALLQANKDAMPANLEEEQKIQMHNNVAKAKLNIAKLLKIENIEFEVAKGTLTVKGKSTVTKLANILKQYPNIHIEIAGHTDDDGSADFNQKLSQSRVDTVKNTLIMQGVSKQRLTAKGYGESRPLVPNTSDKNKQKNRRVEINIQGE